MKLLATTVAISTITASAIFTEPSVIENNEVDFCAERPHNIYIYNDRTLWCGEDGPVYLELSK